MKYLVAGLVLLVSVAAINIVPNISNELPELPPFEEMLDWKPKQDRTIEVTFPDISFRYSILDWKPAPECQAVSAMPETEELRWVTHAGMFAHQYLTKNTPTLYKRRGSSEWYWLSLKTYKEK